MLAQAQVTGTHDGVAVVALPSVTVAEGAEMRGATSTVAERETLAQAHGTGTHNVAEVASPFVTAAEVAKLSGAASAVEEREKLAQAQVTGTHDGVAVVA